MVGIRIKKKFKKFTKKIVYAIKILNFQDFVDYIF